MPTASRAARAPRGRKTSPKTVAVTAVQRHRMIEEAAYLRAEQRDFQGGDPIADWLLSEREVDALLSTPSNT